MLIPVISPSSAWFLLWGRFISGAGGILRPIMVAEIARCYPDAEATSAYAWVGMGYAIGFIVGECQSLPSIKLSISSQ